MKSSLQADVKQQNLIHFTQNVVLFSFFSFFFFNFVTWCAVQSQRAIRRRLHCAHKRTWSALILGQGRMALYSRLFTPELCELKPRFPVLMCQEWCPVRSSAAVAHVLQICRCRGFRDALQSSSFSDCSLSSAVSELQLVVLL